MSSRTGESGTIAAVPDAPAETSPENPTGSTDTPDTPAAPLSWRARFRSWPRAGRWATYVAVVLCLAIVAGLVAGVVMVRKPFPQTDGEIEVPGLGAEVRVLRDGHGIPQVYADTSDDLFYAQGYVQAQDRFYEMDVRRHITVRPALGAARRGRARDRQVHPHDGLAPRRRDRSCRC